MKIYLPLFVATLLESSSLAKVLQSLIVFEDPQLFRSFEIHSSGLRFLKEINISCYSFLLLSICREFPYKAYVFQNVFREFIGSSERLPKSCGRIYIYIYIYIYTYTDIYVYIYICTQ